MTTWMKICSASRHTLSLDSSRKGLIIEHSEESSKHQFWRLDENGQLRNQAVGLDWELGEEKQGGGGNIAGGVQASHCVGQGVEILNFKKVVKEDFYERGGL